MKTFIILLPIKYERKLVEHQENMTFNNTIELKQAYPEDSIICNLKPKLIVNNKRNNINKPI